MKISIGCDHRGYELKKHLMEVLKRMEIKYNDNGTYSDSPCDYPDLAQKVCEDIEEGLANFGILICKTGTGMCISANKMPGIRAAVIFNSDICVRAKGHNNINVMCLGADFTKEDQLEELVKLFITTPFEEDRHSRRLEKIRRMERGY